MIADVSLLNALVTIGFGAMAGGLTNAVAIWMLFHPHEARGVGALKFQGALPKNKARLAKTIGRTVGQRLLTAEDLTRQLSTPDIRRAFDATVRDMVTSLLETERPSLRTLAGPALEQELSRIADALAASLGARVAEFVTTPAFRDAVERFLTRAREEVADRPVGTVLTTARREAIRARVEAWVGEAVHSDQLDATIRAWLDRQMDRLAADRTPLLERLPGELVGALERAIAGYLPVAIDRLAAIVGDPAARARVEAALHGLFERFARDLMFHERIVAKLVVTEKTFTRLLSNFERAGADDLARLLEEPAMRSQVAKGINDAVVQFLQRPLSEHFERLGAERVEAIKQTLAAQIVAALRDTSTRAHAIEQLDRALQAAEQRTWGDLLRYLPPDQAADWLAGAADTPRLNAWVTDATRAALAALLDKPIGRPGDWLGADAGDRVTEHVAPALWQWIEGQIPRVVERVDIQTMVEQKVLSFSLQRMEEIVRNTTQRELDLIVRLGYVLGAFVGAIAYAVTVLLG